jgi:hypothetical protein
MANSTTRSVNPQTTYTRNDTQKNPPARTRDSEGPFILKNVASNNERTWYAVFGLAIVLTTLAKHVIDPFWYQKRGRKDEI